MKRQFDNSTSSGDDLESKTQKSVNALYPIPNHPKDDEEVKEGQEFVPSPMCPRCHNVDPRSYIDKKMIDSLRETAQIPSTAKADVEGTITPVTRYLSSGDDVKCHCCDHIFDFCAFGNIFNLDDPDPKNMKKSSAK